MIESEVATDCNYRGLAIREAENVRVTGKSVRPCETMKTRSRKMGIEGNDSMPHVKPSRQSRFNETLRLRRQ